MLKYVLTKHNNRRCFTFTSVCACVRVCVSACVRACVCVCVCVCACVRVISLATSLKELILSRLEVVIIIVAKIYVSKVIVFGYFVIDIFFAIFMILVFPTLPTGGIMGRKGIYQLTMCDKHSLINQ